MPPPGAQSPTEGARLIQQGEESGGRASPGDDCRRPQLGERRTDERLARQLDPTAVEPSDGLFDAVVSVHAYGREVSFEMPEQDYRRGPGAAPTTGPQDAKAPAWWVAEAEALVLDLTAGGRTVTSDDLRERYPHEPSATGAAIGALFKRLAHRGLLQLVGHCPSTRPEARGRVVGIWRRP